MHIMIDLETMGTAPGSAIVAVGAVFFDAEGVHETFYQTCTLDSAVGAGLSMDPGTIMWWMKQGDAARDEIITAMNTMPNVLKSLADRIRIAKVVGVWGNGATFDNVLTRVAMEKCDINVPWGFWQDKCYRTVKGAHPDIELVREGTAHKAIDDALSQAKHLIAINKAAGGIYL